MYILHVYIYIYIQYLSKVSDIWTQSLDADAKIMYRENSHASGIDGPFRIELDDLAIKRSEVR